jgi:hypothetical protein
VWSKKRKNSTSKVRIVPRSALYCYRTKKKKPFCFYFIGKGCKFCVNIDMAWFGPHSISIVFTDLFLVFFYMFATLFAILR